MLFIDIFTLFPVVFESIMKVSMWKKAQEVGAVSFNLWNLRDFSRSKQYKVDAPPFGGGGGMVMRVEPIVSAVEQVKSKSSWVVGLSAAGSRFDWRKAVEFSKKEHLIFLCGHYEGIDQRVIDLVVDEEISIGDFVLTGGELAAMVIIDAVIRFLPDVLGYKNGMWEDSFASGFLEYPHYTRPDVFRGIEAPSILRSGNHNEVENWRRRQAYNITKERRPDLLEGGC